MNKAQIDSIFPLNASQKALLFNHISNKIDNGFLTATCTILGTFDEKIMEKSFESLFNQYEAFRSSIHWKKISQEVQIIQKDATEKIEFIDWSNKLNHEFIEEYNGFVDTLNSTHLDLTKAPISKFYFIKKSATESKFLWRFHHIIFDGWSSIIILKKLLSFYEEHSKGVEPQIDTLPPLKSVNSKFVSAQKNEISKKFWLSEIGRDYEAPFLFNQKTDRENKYSNISFSLNKQKLTTFCKANKITLTSLLQTIWAICLHKITTKEQVVFGTVVSGRSLDLPKINEIVGLLTNLLPVVGKIDTADTISTVCNKIQKHHSTARDNELLSMETIFKWTNWQGNIALFDSLLIVENFLTEDLKSPSLEIIDYKSGILSKFPLTLTFIPTKNEVLMGLKYSNTSISKKEIDWIKESFLLIIEKLSDDLIISSLTEQINAYPNENIEVEKSISGSHKNYDSVLNETENTLVNIWEKALNISPISPTDNFFELGGKSFHAIRLFNEISKAFHKKILPSTLIENPTIRQITKIIGKPMETDYPLSIPFRENGENLPVFCIHAGGAHVFFYRELAKNIHHSHPVWGIQPKGLDGSKPHKDIKTMATAYINEIEKNYPNSPFHIIGYCLSGAIVLEITNQLLQAGKKVGRVIILDSYPYPHYLAHQLNTKWNWKNKFKRNIIKGGLFTKLLNKVKAEKIVIEDPMSNEYGGLETLQNHIWAEFKAYHWPSVNHPMLLIRSTDYSTADKAYHVEGWKELSENQLSLELVDANHVEILNPPAVYELADKINKYLATYTNQNISELDNNN